MSDDADTKKQVNEAMEKFNAELQRLKEKFVAETDRIIADAKEKRVAQLKESITQPHE